MDKPGESVDQRRPPPFEVEPAPLGDAAGVLVRGEVDVATAPMLTGQLDAAMRDTVGAFVVDLSDVTFVDSTGIAVLVHARAFLGRDDRHLAVVCPPGPVRRLFDVAGVSDLFPLFESRDDVAAFLQPIGPEP